MFFLGKKETITLRTPIKCHVKTTVVSKILEKLAVYKTKKQQHTTAIVDGFITYVIVCNDWNACTNRSALHFPIFVATS